MSRLIDADILDNNVMHLFISITGNPKQHTVVNECKSSFRRMIEEQPTVEAVPVVHGEWVNDEGYDKWTCSECGHLENYDEYPAEYGLNFCSHCGADMRKRKKV